MTIRKQSTAALRADEEGLAVRGGWMGDLLGDYDDDDGRVDARVETG